jgi:hypothetical protein
VWWQGGGEVQDRNMVVEGGIVAQKVETVCIVTCMRELASACVSIREHTDLVERGNLRHNAHTHNTRIHTRSNTRARTYTHTRILSGNATTLESRCGSSYILLNKSVCGSVSI